MNNEQTLNTHELKVLYDKYSHAKAKIEGCERCNESYSISTDVALCLNEILYNEFFIRYRRDSSSKIKQAYCARLDALLEDAEKILWRMPKNHTIRREGI